MLVVDLDIIIIGGKNQRPYYNISAIVDELRRRNGFRLAKVFG